MDDAGLTFLLVGLGLGALIFPLDRLLRRLRRRRQLRDLDLEIEQLLSSTRDES